MDTIATPLRRRDRRHRTRILPAAGALALIAVLTLLAAPAGAHDPIFVTEDQDSPETGPYLPDGTISFAIYGSLLAGGDTRGLEFDLRDGDDLYLSLLIPDLAPENELADADLPRMTLVLPDGTEREITAAVREPFAEPFSGTDYVTLFETVEPATGGRHQVTVTGDSPTRFVVAVGLREEFFTPAERTGDRPSSFPGIAAPLNEWYSTPADGSTPSDDSEVDVDVELMEEALDELDENGLPIEDAAADAETDADDGAADQAAQAGDDAAGLGDDDGGGTGWVAPVAALTAVAAGGSVLLRRRRLAASANGEAEGEAA